MYRLFTTPTFDRKANSLPPDTEPDWLSTGYHRLLQLAHPLTAVALEITTRCNLCCRHCLVHDQRGTYAELPFELIVKTLALIRKAAFRKPLIALTGGEPFCHPRFADLLDHLERQRFDFTICTNGTLLDDRWLARLRSLRRLRSVGISIDGNRDAHEAARGAGTFSAAMDALARLAGSTDKKIIVKTVLQQGNQDQLPAIAELVRHHRVAQWHIIPLIADSGALTATEERVARARLEELARHVPFAIHFGETGEVRDPRAVICSQGSTACAVLANGDIVTCTHAPGFVGNRSGNIYTDRFDQVWDHGFTHCRSANWRGCSFHQAPVASEVSA